MGWNAIHRTGFLFFEVLQQMSDVTDSETSSVLLLSDNDNAELGDIEDDIAYVDGDPLEQDPDGDAGEEDGPEHHSEAEVEAEPEGEVVEEFAAPEPHAAALGPQPGEAFQRPAALVKRGAAGGHRQPIPFRFKRRIVAFVHPLLPHHDFLKFLKDGTNRKDLPKGILRKCQAELLRISRKKHSVHRIEQVLNWCQLHAEGRLQGKRCRRQRVALGKHDDIEKLTYAYWAGIRAGNGRVTRLQLQEFALKELQKKTKNDKAAFSAAWIYRFFRRTGLRTRTIKRQLKLTDLEAEQKIQALHEHIFSLHKSGQVQFVMQLDEIPASLSGLCSFRCFLLMADLSGTMGKATCVTRNKEENVIFDAADTKRC